MDNKVDFDIAVFLKKWKVIALFAAIALIITFCYSSFFVEKQYQYGMTYFIKNSSSDNRFVSTESMNSSRLLVESYMKMISTNEMMQYLSDSMNENYGLDFSRRYLKSHIKATGDGTTEIMHIYVTANSPEICDKISCGIQDFMIPRVEEIIASADVIHVTPNVQSNDPVSPNITRNSILGFIVGIIIGIAYVFITLLTNNRVTDEEELSRKVNVPVLGIIPDINSISKGEYEYGSKKTK